MISFKTMAGKTIHIDPGLIFCVEEYADIPPVGVVALIYCEEGSTHIVDQKTGERIARAIKQREAGSGDEWKATDED